MPPTKLEKFIDQTTKASAARSLSEVRDRYHGVILAVAVGNSLGLPVEGLSRRHIENRFPTGIAEIDSAEKQKPWDDDVAQTVILAEAILEKGELDLGDLAQRLVCWASENGRGMGIQTAQVISRLAAGVKADEAARLVWESGGRTAAGNGAVMRCVPVALRWRNSGSRLVKESIKSALITHFDPRCTWSVVALNAGLASILNGVAPDLYRLASLLDEAGSAKEVTAGVRQAEECSLETLGLDGADMGYTTKAMQVGLWALQQDPDFETILVEVVKAGGDTDTNGAVAGAVAGARIGTAGIPERWLQNIRDTNRLETFADRLLQASEDV